MNTHRRLFTVLIFVTALWVTDVAAQETTPRSKTQTELPSVQEVISRYFVATGGIENHTSITSVVRKGVISVEAFGVKSNTQVWLTAPDKGVVKSVTPGAGTVRQGYDGETAWNISELLGPQLVTGGRATQLIQELDMHPFVDFDKKFESVKCTGIEEFSGKPCFVVVAQHAGDEVKPITNYFAVDSGLHLGSKKTAITAMGEMDVVMTASDYREVGGIKFPYKTSAEIQLGKGIISIVEWESVEFNVEIDPAKFELPAEVKALKEGK